MLAGSAALVIACIRSFRAGVQPLKWTTSDTRLALASAIFAVLWQVNNPHGFKILMDELVVNATAMSMHFDREIFVPLRTHVVDGQFLVLGGIVDKRPNFFPLLLSLLHDFSGYRLANVFILNAALSVLLLFVTGRLGRHLSGGKEQAGLFGIALLGGLPLLGVNATSGSFEILNLLMIGVCMLLACKYLQEVHTARGGSAEIRIENARSDPAYARSAATQDVLVLATVLLAQTRYESALFVGATAATVLWGWWRLRRPLWSWSLVVAPLLLVIVPLQSKVFAVNARDYWQLTQDLEQPFMLKFIPENFGHAVRFLFTVDGFQLGSPVLSGFGVVCTIFFVVFLIRRWRQVRTEPDWFVLGTFALVVFANLALLLCYFWGQLDDFMATRLGLPLLLVLTLASTFVLGRWIKRPAVWCVITAIPLVWAMAETIPMSSRATSTMGFLSYQEVKWELAFLHEHANEHALFVLPAPLPGVLERQAAISVQGLSEHAEQMAKHLTEQSYATVYVFQRLELEATSHEWQEVEGSELGAEFELETVAERRFKPLYKMRLSRLRSVELSRQAPRPPDWKPKFPPFQVTPAGTDASAADVYVQKYLSDLP